MSFEDLTFAYPGAPKPALSGVNLSLTEGSFVLVAGPTGSGKSTLLRSINGLVPHFSGGTFEGRVLVEGRDTLEQAPRDLAHLIAFVPQDPATTFVLDRVEDEIAYGMENLATPPQQMRRRVEEMLDLLSLASLRRRSVREISGGERQRVAIAGALASGPRILVLDEPTSQLDPQGAEDVLAALQRLVHDLALTIVVAEHRLERVVGFADVMIGCNDGVCSMGAPRDVIRDLCLGPPVARLAQLQGWMPLPLTVREARRLDAAHVGRPPEDRRSDAGRPILRARGLEAGYGARRVLGPIDLELRRGEVTALMGRNGSGKTTLLRCLVGLHKPLKGDVSFEGRQVEPGRDVALCPQTPETVLFKDSVADEIAATLRWSKGHAQPNEPTETLGIERLARRHPRDLSAGERLLVATAATAATGAAVLLLDEPTRGLDHEVKEKICTFLRAHVAGDGAVMLATHDVELTAEVADRVIVMADGEIIADGPPATVMGDSPIFAPQMSRVYGAGWLTPEQVHAALQGVAP